MAVTFHDDITKTSAPSVCKACNRAIPSTSRGLDPCLSLDDAAILKAMYLSRSIHPTPIEDALY